MEHVHLIGIGGSGLSAIARLLLESGYEVSGSDQAMSAWAQDLVEHGVRVIIGHSADNIAGADLIVRSSAIPESNVEIRQRFRLEFQSTNATSSSENYWSAMRASPLPERTAKPPPPP